MAHHGRDKGVNKELRSTSVLLVDADRDQARLHEIVLNSRGHEAVSVSSVSKALGLIGESSFDVLILTEDMLRLLDESNDLEGETRIIVVKTTDDFGDQELFTRGVDFIWHLGDSPMLLINQVEHLLQHEVSAPKKERLLSQVEMEILSEKDDELLQAPISGSAAGPLSGKIPSRNKH